MVGKAGELERKLAALKETYIAQLGGRIANLENAFQDIRIGNDFASIKEGLEQLAFHAHKLAGTAGTFGFPELGQRGGEIEVKCDDFVKTETNLSDAQKDDLAKVVAICRTLAEV